jgi:predicted DNA-binding ribbon-helix-helix protein
MSIQEKHWIQSGRPVKRSISIAGHKTSFSLEEPFWVALKEIAKLHGQSVASIICYLDEMRFVKKGDIGLSGAIRLFVMRHYMEIIQKRTNITSELFSFLGLDKDDAAKTEQSKSAPSKMKAKEKQKILEDA